MRIAMIHTPLTHSMEESRFDVCLPDDSQVSNFPDSAKCGNSEQFMLSSSIDKTYFSAVPSSIIKVSALVSTYNSEKFIRGCLQDLVDQTLYQKGELEIIVVNSGSQQNEETIVKEFQRRYTNIKYIKTERETIYQAWNRGIKAATGYYITFANTDDRHRIDALEVMAKELDNYPDIVLVYGDQFITETDNEVFGQHTAVDVFNWPDFDRDKLLKVCCIGPQPMWRKSVHSEFGYFDEKLQVAGDYEFWLRISQKYYFKHIPEYIGLYLRSPQSVEHKNQKLTQMETIAVQEKHRTLGKKSTYSKRDIPLVSIIVPTYNRPHMLVEALKSILNQTYPNYEIIVANDAGDDVGHVISSLNTSGKITCVRHGRNKDRAAARNTGLKIAQGKYIAYLDDDDLFYPDHLETLVRFLETCDYKVAYTDAYRAHQEKINGSYVVRKKDVPYSFDFDYDSILEGNFVPILCFMHEKACVDEVGLFDESLTTHEDWDLWIRMSRKFKFAHIKKITCEFAWRTDGTTTTSKKRAEFLKTMEIIYKKYEEYSKDKPQILQRQIINLEALRMQEETSAKKEKQDLSPTNDTKKLIGLNRGNTLIEMGKLNEAIKEFEKVVNSYPDSPDVFINLGSAYYKNGDLEKAEECFKNAIKLDATNTTILKYLAHLFFDKKDYSKAISKCEAILLKDCKDADTLVLLSNCYFEMNAYEAALIGYQKALEISPKHKDAKKGIALVKARLKAKEKSKSCSSTSPLPLKKIKNYVPNEVNGKAKCSIIIPVYNKVEYTKQCLTSLFENTDYENYEVIVVDNGSTDGTKDFLLQASKQYQNLSIIENKKNLGFAKACNQGIKSANGEYVLLLNNDTFISQPDWLENMVNEAESDQKIAIVGACLLYPENDLIQHVGVVIGIYGKVLMPFHKYKLRKFDRVPQAHASRDYKIVTGACMLIRREIFKEIGLLDEGFINSYEDVDFCLKAIISGYRVRYCHNSLVYHYESMSPNRHDYDMINLMRLNERWNGKVQPDENLKNLRDLDLWDMWMREELQKDPDHVACTLRLIQICQIRGDREEVAELEDRLEDICKRHYHTPIMTSIIIPTFNNLHLTRQCLEAIRSNTAAGRYEIIIVDNGSTDGTQEFIRRQANGYQNLRIVENTRNIGFAKACNQGAKIAQGRYLLFLNNDTVPHPHWLNFLLQMAEEDKSTGILGNKLLYPDGTVQHAGVVVGTRNGETYPYHIYLCQPANAPFVNKPREFQMVTGACLMIRRTLFEQIGGFDETFVNGHEDLDLCIRVRQARYKVMYCPNSVVTHLESRTKRLIGLDNFNYKQGVDNNEGRGRRRFLEKWQNVLKIDDHIYYTEDGYAKRSSDSLNILFTMYGWNESGGGTLFPKSVAKELVKRGHTVSVFYASLKTDPSMPAYSILKEIDDGVLLYGIYNRPAIFIDPDNPEREIHDKGVTEKFRKVLNEVKPDVVHFHNFHGLTFAMAKETKRRCIPTCYTPHNYHMIDPNLYLFNSDLSLWKDTDILKNSEAVKRNPDKRRWYEERSHTTRTLLNEWINITLAVSSRQKELLVHHGAKPELIAVVHQSSRSTDALWNSSHLLQEGSRPLHSPIRVGFIGGVMPHKGVHMMVAASQAFNSSDVEFHVYGFVGGKYLEQLRTFDKKNMVRFHGEYKQEQLESIAHEIDIAIVPSIWEDCAPLVLLELMAMRLPVIAAAIGGIPDFVKDGINGFLYKHDSIESLKKSIAYCIKNQGKVRAMRAALRQPHSFSRYIAHLEKIYRALHKKNLSEAHDCELLIEIENVHTCYSKFAVAWEGSQFVNHSLALINRELTIALTKSQKCDLSLIPYEMHQFGKEADPERFGIIEERLNKAPSKPVEFYVRHQYPPNFNPPEAGYWINIQPWEFGSLPKHWIEPMQNLIDELWVPSNYVRRCYINSGINPEKVFIIPNGVNVNAFNPQTQPIRLNTKKSFKFLFVGGTIWRKGIDILLETYVRSFTRNDDVCLVIKDMGRESFYKGQDASKVISAIQTTPNTPEILYLTEDIPVGKMAGLYTACDCLVHPYRGEGFGLPVAEAMACGLPVIVTRGGAADDFCTSETGYQLPAKVVYFGNKELVSKGWVLDPDRIALSKQMKYVFENRDEARLKGLNASKYIKEDFTWEDAANMIIKRFAALRSKPILRYAEKLSKIPNKQSKPKKKKAILSHA